MGERGPAKGGSAGQRFGRAAERLLRSPLLYDLVQWVAGDREFRRHLASHLDALPDGASLIDLGGGTGLPDRRWPAARYVCLDVDFAKLRRFRAGRPGRLAVVADAAVCPFEAERFDGVLCAKVVHHLRDDVLRAVLAESARILKPGGVLILVDAVLTPRTTSRILWRLDRGSFPRTASEIRLALRAAFSVMAWEEFRIAAFHDFVLCAARKATVPVAPLGRTGGRAWMTD